MPPGLQRPGEDAGRETIRQFPEKGADSAFGAPPGPSTGEFTQAMTPSQAGRSGSRTPDPMTDGSFVERGEVVLAPGQVVFEKYEVVRQLGEGGMGEVWLVHDLSLDVDRALKMIKPKAAFDQEARRRLHREAKALAKLEHPNIVGVRESPRFDRQDAAYMVMEYVPGVTLDQILNKSPGRPLPLDWIAHVLKQLCDGLALAHSKGIIHRDLKPSNLMVVETANHRDQLKILDFGIAKLNQIELGVDDAKTQTGAFMGTPYYTSPEQAIGLAEPRSDLYSVGVILYEMLAGRRPFAGPMAILLAAHQSATPTPIAQANPEANVPPAVERVVMRCLAKKPDDRPGSADALFEEFREALGVEETEVATRRPRPIGNLPTQAQTRTKANSRSGRYSLDDILTGKIDRSASSGVGPALVGDDPALDGRPGRSRILRIAAAVVALAALLVLAGVFFKPGKTPPPPAKPPDSFADRGREFYLWRDKFYLPVGYKPVNPDDESYLDSRGWPVTLKREADGVLFHRISGGEFVMGATTDRPPPDGDQVDQKERTGNLPNRKATLRSFYIQEAEVTNAELKAFFLRHPEFDREPDNKWRSWYNKLLDPRGDPAGADRHPAHQMTWAVASAFAREQRGWLPTEWQWEYAARSRDPSRNLVWDAKLDSQRPVSQLANIATEGELATETQPVGSFREDQTDQRVKDMAGNVREWCRDAFETYGGMGPDGPRSLDEASPGTPMVVRGASFHDSRDFRFVTLRRDPELSEEPPLDVGFRLVIECPELSEAVRSTSKTSDAGPAKAPRP